MVIRRIVAAAAAALVVAALVPSSAGAAQQGLWWQSTWQMPQVWQLTDGTGITVAVIDSGVDASAADLAGVIIPGTDLYDQGGDGTVDHDPDTHGTAMALLIAGRGGSSGLVGAVPGAMILPIAADPQGVGGEAADRYSTGIRYAVDHGAHVVNISMVSLAPSIRAPCPEQVAAAVRYAVSRDVVVVAGSGNRPGGEAWYPGSCPGVVTVGAVDSDLQPWEDSHRSEYVDVAAPGVDIAALTPDGRVYDSAGTSNSTALVSGVVALIRAQFPEASADEVVTRLLATVQDVAEPGRDDATGYGLVRPYEALTEAVPPNAANPVYEGLDLTDVADPGPEELGHAPPTAPALPEPPTVGAGAGDGSGGSVLPVLLAVVGVVLLAGALLTVLLVVRASRRRRQQNLYPVPAPPAHHPG